MPRRPGRRSRSQPRWSLSEPPPGLFPAGGEDLLRFLAVLAIAAGVAAACSLFNRRPNPNPNPLCDSDSPYADYGDFLALAPNQSRSSLSVCLSVSAI
jgi:hypothetical protein